MIVRPARTRRGVLRQSSQFEAVQRSGVRVATRNFVARALANDADEARLGLIAGRRAAPRAVDRNRAKRLIRETFRAAASRFHALDVTVQLRSNLRSIENDTIRGELLSLFNSLVRRCSRPVAVSNGTAPPIPSSDRQ